MAFMMPVMKNNYPLYAAGPVSKQQRRTSDTDASKRSKSQQIVGASGGKRKVRSEGPSLSTSPGSGNISVQAPANLQVPTGKGARPIPMMGRVRGSAPVLGAHSMPLHRHNSMPHGPQSVAGSAPTKPTSPARSDSSSSSSEPASPTVTGKFHLKLIARLRRSLRLKDPTPTTASTSTPPPEPAATTA